MAQSLSPYRIGTRGSPLAIKQTEIVRARLCVAHGLRESDFEIVAMRTTGDRVLNQSLADVGGKGLFTKEIDEALLSGRVDFAVHSAKDVPTLLPQGISLAAYPPRDDVRDVLISVQNFTLEKLPAGATIGTSSIRRQALVKRLRSDLSIKLMRGNVETRLHKIERGEFHAAILAFAGLERLGLQDRPHVKLDPAVFPPASGQGAIAIAIRTDNERVKEFVGAIDHAPTHFALTTERAFLAALDGSCRAPIAGHAQIKNGRLHFYGLVIAPDGSDAVETRREGMLNEAAAMGADAGNELRARAAAGVLDA
jgi:hydroxymethylbilane synthase